MEPGLSSTSGHARAELVVNAVADAFFESDIDCGA